MVMCAAVTFYFLAFNVPFKVASYITIGGREGRLKLS